MPPSSFLFFCVSICTCGASAETTARVSKWTSSDADTTHLGSCLYIGQIMSLDRIASRQRYCEEREPGERKTAILDVALCRGRSVDRRPACYPTRGAGLRRGRRSRNKGIIILGTRDNPSTCRAACRWRIVLSLLYSPCCFLFPRPTCSGLRWTRNRR